MKIYKSKGHNYEIKGHIYFACDNHTIIDLTEAFGKGNEPTDITDERLIPFIKVSLNRNYGYGDRI